MYTNYEEILEQIKLSRANIDGFEQRLEEIEAEVKELDENYPDINIDQIISENVDVITYFESRKKRNELKLEKEDLNSKYMQELNNLDELEVIKSEHEKRTEQERIKTEKELEEKEENKNKYIEKLNSLLHKEGILKGKEASMLAEMANDLRNNGEINFLTDEEKKEYISSMDNKLSDNNNLLNEQGIKVKEAKIKTSKKCVITDKLKSVVAKGKIATISFMKNVFDKSIDKVVKLASGLAKSIYSKAVANSKKEMRKQLDTLLDKRVHFVEDDNILEQMADAQNAAREEEEEKRTKVSAEDQEKIRYFHSEEFNLDPDKVKAEEERIFKEKAELEKRKIELSQIKNQASMILDSDLSGEIEEVRPRVM